MEKDFKIFHLGYVFKDLDKQIESLKSLNNKIKFNIFEQNDIPSLYRGKDSKISLKIAVSQLFNLNIEIIQPLEGESPYKEFLERGKEGLHHIAISVNNIVPYIEEYQKKGTQILLLIQVGTFDVVYLDTEKELGIVIEFIAPLRKERRKHKNQSL